MLSTILLTSAAVVISTLIYHVVSLRYLHPLSKYPGPLFASISGWWRIYHEVKGDLPQIIHSLHQKYGPFIRVAPNEIDTISPDFVDVILKGGRKFAKSDYYDGSGGIKPNVFSTRDEAFHALRRRQMSYGFSSASFARMEGLFDRNVEIMIRKLNGYAKTGEAVNLSNVLKFYSQDVNGELSFSKQYGLQERDDITQLPPMSLYQAVAKCYGYVPGLRGFMTKYGSHVPYISSILRSRMLLIGDAFAVAGAEFKRRQVQHLEKTFDTEDEGRINLLTSLATAKDPDTGEELSVMDIAGEAMTFVVAGSHSTATAIIFYFIVLLTNPSIMKKVQEEIAASVPLPPAAEDAGTFDPPEYAGLESKLPYCSAVLKEVFRLFPTVNHPFGRVVPIGIRTSINDNELIPGSIISGIPYALHRNPEIWGNDAELIRPERWLTKVYQGKEKYLIHFGSGHRACIGRNEALISIWKAIVGILQRFDIQAVDMYGAETTLTEIPITATGFADLGEPLIVKLEKKI
jgi:cytochrome P450